MKKYENLLAKLGLSECERHIYLYLLLHPYKIVADIVRATKYHRPMVYKGLRALEDEGLVEKSYLEGKRYFYHAANPEKLKDRLSRLTQIAEDLIPELEHIHEKTAEAPILSIKEGIAGIRDIHEDLVTTLPKNGIYYRYSSSKREYGKRETFLPSNYFSLQQSKELERYVISNEEREKSHNNNPYRDMVAIPRGFDLFDDNITKIIYSNKVSIIDYDAQIGWTIESERFARYEEKIFRLLHSLLKKQKK